MILDRLGNSAAGKAHRRLHNVWLHDVADRMYLRRLSMAKDSGLSEDKVEQYPVSGDTTIYQGGNRTSAGLILAGVGLVAASILGTLSMVGPRAAERPLEVVPVKAPAPPPQEFKVTFWAEDGTEIGVQPPEKLK